MNSKVKIFLIFLILFTVSVSASSEEDHGNGFWGTFLSQIVNSTILFGGIILLSRKHVIKYFTQQSLDIKNKIVINEKNLKEKSGQLNELKQRLDKIEEEVERIKSLAKESGIQEGKRIEEMGEKESKKILAITETEIDHKVESSIKKLKSRIAELTINQFKKDIESQLDDEQHNKIIDDNIKRSGEIIEREQSGQTIRKSSDRNTQG